MALRRTEQLDAGECGRFADPAAHGVALGTVAGHLQAGVWQPRSERLEGVQQHVDALADLEVGEEQDRLLRRSRRARAPDAVVDAVRQLTHSRSPGSPRFHVGGGSRGREQQSGGPALLRRSHEALYAQLQRADPGVRARPGRRPVGVVRAQQQRRLVAGQREAHPHVDRVELVGHVEAALAGQPPVQAPQLPHEARPPDLPETVHVHIRRQLLLERDRPRGHVQLMPSARQLAYVAERRKPVTVRQVVCKQRRRGND
jgi:hypothetical protein